MVVAPETDRAGAAALGERIRVAVEVSGFAYKDATIRVTVSVGVAVVDDTTPAEYDQLKHAAAAALQQAKSQGRNRCFVNFLPFQDSAEPSGPAPHTIDSSL